MIILFLLVYIIQPGKPWPACDRKHALDIIDDGANRWQCDADTGTWRKETVK